MKKKKQEFLFDYWLERSLTNINFVWFARAAELSAGMFNKSDKKLAENIA